MAKKSYLVTYHVAVVADDKFEAEEEAKRIIAEEEVFLAPCVEEFELGSDNVGHRKGDQKR